MINILYILILFNFSIFADLEFKSDYKRIISLGPGITESIYLLKSEDKLIGCTNYCIRPIEAKNKIRVGTIIDVNVELIFSLKPDVVIATPLTDSKAIQKLINLKIPIIKLKIIKNFEDICEQFLTIGKITNQFSLADKIIKENSYALNKIQKINSKNKPKVFVQIGINPLFTATKNSFIDHLISYSGGYNIVQSDTTGIYSKEKVILDNPDFIIVALMDQNQDVEITNWNKYKTINAVKNKNIFVFDTYTMCSPTPISFVESVKKLTNIFYKT